MVVFILNILLFLLLLLLIVVYSMLWPPDSPWAPWWRTNEKIADAICRIGKIEKNDIVYDLGCGDGVLINTVAKKYGAKAVGIEIDIARYLFAKARVKFNRLSKQVRVVRDNFFRQPISSATVVVVYLVPKALQALRVKFLKELKPGTRVVSYRYKMNLPLIATDKKNDLMVYKIPGKMIKTRRNLNVSFHPKQ
jgi:16S rRNA A1518/A1519 N6-dimethyltransferase RsmA/KsgA/DIM1 with predicted DNA glycosylase/AP lyase activity